MTKGATTRERIVQTALAVATVEGLDGVSLAPLATHVGMSKSGLFAHFASKEALQLAVVEAAVARFREAVVLPALTHPRGEARLRAAVRGWLAWMRSEAYPGGCFFMQAISEIDDRPGPVRDALAASQQAWFDFLTGAVRLAVDTGELRADVEPELLAFQIVGVGHAHHELQRLHRDPRALGLAERSVDALLVGARRA